MKSVGMLTVVALASSVSLYGMDRRGAAFVPVDIEAGGDSLAQFYDEHTKTLQGTASAIFGRGLGDVFAKLKDAVVGKQVEHVVITDYSFVYMEKEQLEALLGQLVQLQLKSPALKSIKLLESDAGGAAPTRGAGGAGASALLGGMQAELPGLLQALLIKEEEGAAPAQKPGVQVIELGGVQVPIILVPQVGSEPTVKTIQMGQATVIMFVYPVSPASSWRKPVAVAAAGILSNVISVAATVVVSQLAR